MTAPWTVLSLPPLPEPVIGAVLGPLGDRIRLVLPPERTPEALLASIAQADVVIGDWSGALPLTAEAIAAAPRLCFVQQPSTGVDRIDVPALTARGIPLANTATSNSVSVAEWTVAAALSLSRSMVWADARVREGGWPQLDIATQGCLDLAGRRVGIVGFGEIGQVAARRFAAFDCPVSYWSRTQRPPELEHGATYRELDDLCCSSDVLVLVLPLTPETTGLIDARRLAMLPWGAHVVDAGRGGVMDVDALLTALDGTLGGAALDVFPTEPLPAGAAVRSHPKVLLSPHVAGATAQARFRLLGVLVDNLGRALDGRPVLHVVNGVDAVVVRRS